MLGVTHKVCKAGADGVSVQHHTESPHPWKGEATIWDVAHIGAVEPHPSTTVKLRCSAAQGAFCHMVEATRVR